jgi:multiple sugar transport system ATP-binding protein
MPDIKLKKVVKRFGKVTALKEMSLDIKDGEFFVLVGPTGAGKTTTLRVVSGLEKIDNGEILMGGENAADLSPAERDVAFVYQSFSLYPQMTVRQNLEFPLKSPLHKEAKEEVNKRVEFVAKLLHITPLLDRMPNALSGGEMQRVGIGRAIVRKPNIFLMDEPLSDLDAKLREELRVELRQIQQELKTTTLYVTHDQIEAMSMGDRVAVLNEGVVHQIGSPKEVYNTPSDLFVAGFIGIPKMNFFSCAVQGGTGGAAAVLSLEGGNIKLPFGGTGGETAVKKIQGLPRKEGLVLGVRPEAVKIHTAKGAGAFQADVLFLEHFGSMNIVNLKVGDKLFKSRTPATFRVESNQKVGISFDEDKMILFDAETGKAMN